MPSAPDAPVIYVLGGVNGAGKSSLGGALIRHSGLDYFNPDEVARRIRDTIACTPDEANSLAWEEGKRRLQSAIRGPFSDAFETTLGGHTIPALLVEAGRAGIEVLVWFICLATPEQHIARVRARVLAGGHDIPEVLIRTRWKTSRRNIIALMPYLTELKVFDNSENRLAAGTIPPPRLLLHRRHERIVAPDTDELRNTPEWAKAIVAGALRLQRSSR
jgi:predicted ABC-type ATPase